MRMDERRERAKQRKFFFWVGVAEPAKIIFILLPVVSFASFHKIEKVAFSRKVRGLLVYSDLFCCRSVYSDLFCCRSVYSDLCCCQSIYLQISSQTSFSLHSSLLSCPSSWVLSILSFNIGAIGIFS